MSGFTIGIDGATWNENNVYTIANPYLYVSHVGEPTADFKQWLSENPTTVIYQLAEPVIEELEYNEDLLTFYPSTVINTGVLPTTIKATMKQFR